MNGLENLFFPLRARLVYGISELAEIEKITRGAFDIHFEIYYCEVQVTYTHTHAMAVFFKKLAKNQDAIFRHRF